MTTRPARDAIHRLFESGRTSYRLDELIDAVIAEDRATHAAEVRAAALDQAADFVGNDDDCGCGGCDSCVPNKLAAELRRMAAAARPDNTTRGA